MTPFERRIAKLEAAKRGRGERPVPHTLLVSMDETSSEARVRFAVEWPNRKQGHVVLCVPAKPRTAAEEALYEERLFASQAMLVAAARRDLTSREEAASLSTTIVL